MTHDPAEIAQRIAYVDTPRTDAVQGETELRKVSQELERELIAARIDTIDVIEGCAALLRIYQATQRPV